MGSAWKVHSVHILRALQQARAVRLPSPPSQPPVPRLGDASQTDFSSLEFSPCIPAFILVAGWVLPPSAAHAAESVLGQRLEDGAKGACVCLSCRPVPCWQEAGVDGGFWVLQNLFHLLLWMNLRPLSPPLWGPVLCSMSHTCSGLLLLCLGKSAGSTHM